MPAVGMTIKPCRSSNRTQRVCKSNQNANTYAGQRGQAIIELALLFPFLLALAFLIFDFAIALDRKEVLDHALREGTRMGTLGNSVATIQQSAVDSSEGILTVSDVSVCYQDIDGNGQARNVGDNVRVTLDYDYDVVIGGELLDLFGVVDPSIPMNATADGRLEGEILVAPTC